MHALVLAGGKGSRMRPLTDTRPKPLLPFMGTPLAAGLLRRLHDAGCDRATFLVGAHAEPFAPLRSLGAALGIDVAVVTEEVALDTAGAVRGLVRGATSPVLVCNGDILTDLDYRALVEAHDRAGAVLSLALARVEDPSAFGVVVTDPQGRVRRFVEKPSPGTAPADTVNAGTYLLGPEALAGFDGDGPLSFEREVFPSLLRSGAVLQGFSSGAYWTDLGTPARYRAGHAAVLEGRCAWTPPAGLEMLPGLQAVHQGAEVARTATIRERTVVCDGVRLERGAWLRDAVVLEGAHVEEGAWIEEAVVGAGARIGRAARLGGDAVVGDGATVAAGARLPDGARVPAGSTAPPRGAVSAEHGRTD